MIGGEEGKEGGQKQTLFIEEIMAGIILDGSLLDKSLGFASLAFFQSSSHFACAPATRRFTSSCQSRDFSVELGVVGGECGRVVYMHPSAAKMLYRS